MMQYSKARSRVCLSYAKRHSSKRTRRYGLDKRRATGTVLEHGVTVREHEPQCQRAYAVPDAVPNHKAAKSKAAGQDTALCSLV